MKQQCRYGFTLMELLIVLAIITVLVALLLPTIAGSIGKARQTQCLANFRNLSCAFQLYRSDFDDYFPPVYGGATTYTYNHEFQDISRHWTGLLFPYLKMGTFVFCPAREVPFGTQILDGDNLVFSGYFYNKNLGELSVVHKEKQTIYQTVNEVRLEFPTRTVCVGEGRIGLLAAGTPDSEGNEVFSQYETVIALTLDVLQKLPPGGRRHNGGGNYLFVDGHTRWHGVASLKNKKTSSPTFDTGGK